LASQAFLASLPTALGKSSNTYDSGNMKYITIFGLLLIATTLEASGDAIVRIGLTAAGIPMRVFLMLAGAAILFGYGLSLNLGPLDFGP
jgi:hypothetical protein